MRTNAKQLERTAVKIFQAAVRRHVTKYHADTGAPPSSADVWYHLLSEVMTELMADHPFPVRQAYFVALHKGACEGIEAGAARAAHAENQP